MLTAGGLQKFQQEMDRAMEASAKASAERKRLDEDVRVTLCLLRAPRVVL
jgi:hypothetical protein